MAHNIDQLLENSIRRFGGTRAKRLAVQPYKSLFPLYLRRTNKLRNITTNTFWGGQFSGVLPEAVSTQIWRSGYFSPEVCRSLIAFLKPGMQFVDIGAHFGYFSLLAAHLVGDSGKVLSVEAMPSTFQHLQNNIHKHANSGNVILHQGAAFNEVRDLSFKDYGIVASSLNTAFSNRGNSKLIQEPKNVTVKAQKADTILSDNNIQKPELIKIDAESSEKFVLEGLSETLQRYKPKIVLEIGDDETDGVAESAIINDFLEGFGYRAHEWKGANLLPFKFTGKITYTNLVYLPT